MQHAGHYKKTINYEIDITEKYNKLVHQEKFPQGHSSCAVV